MKDAAAESKLRRTMAIDVLKGLIAHIETGDAFFLSVSAIVADKDGTFARPSWIAMHDGLGPAGIRHAAAFVIGGSDINSDWIKKEINK